jgi:RNA polymerase sigma-70 factor (sigma-E family)
MQQMTDRQRRSGRDEEFTAYASARLPWLGRVAYLLCNDASRADDLVQAAMTRLYIHWGRVSAADNVDGYARTVLVRAFLADQGTAWTRRVTVAAEPSADSPELAAVDLETRLDLRTALAALPARQRAVVVLRFYCDLSVEETAALLGCSQGTVKSQTARGLEALRRVIAPAAGAWARGSESA